MNLEWRRMLSPPTLNGSLIDEHRIEISSQNSHVKAKAVESILSCRFFPVDSFGASGSFLFLSALIRLHVMMKLTHFTFKTFWNAGHHFAWAHLVLESYGWRFKRSSAFVELGWCTGHWCTGHCRAARVVVITTLNAMPHEGGADFLPFRGALLIRSGFELQALPPRSPHLFGIPLFFRCIRY